MNQNQNETNDWKMMWMSLEWCEWLSNDMNQYRMTWHEWDFFSGMTPNGPEWCQNEVSDRNFMTKGLWLEFWKSSALDQSEASILGSRPIGGLDFGPSKFDLGLKISYIPLISASFRPFWSHFWEAVSVCSNFFYFLILQFEPHSNYSRKMWMSLEWDEWLNMI